MRSRPARTHCAPYVRMAVQASANIRRTRVRKRPANTCRVSLCAGCSFARRLRRLLCAQVNFASARDVDVLLQPIQASPCPCSLRHAVRPRHVVARRLCATHPDPRVRRCDHDLSRYGHIRLISECTRAPQARKGAVSAYVTHLFQHRAACFTFGPP